MTVLKGTGVSPGIAVGKVLLIKETENNIQRKNISQVEEEIQRLYTAIRAAKRELKDLFRNAETEIGEKEANILLGQFLMLEDMDFTGYMEEEIRTGKINAEWAVENTRDYYVSLFLSMSTDRMKERAADVKDIANRVIQNLKGVLDQKQLSLKAIKEEVIVAAKELAPSDALQMDAAKVKGILLEVGGKTSHTVILARSLGIPAVVGVSGLTEQVMTGDFVAFDGQESNVYLNPDDEILQNFKTKQRESIKIKSKLLSLKDTPSQTRDGCRIEIAANIASLKDLDTALENGAEGIGLFRTEFLFLEDPPSEQEQFEVYKAAAEKMGNKPVMIRTLDIGGDKEAQWMDLPKEDNPFLGYRAIRLCLDRQELFKTQLRAILRASAYGNIKIMFPMICTVDEIRQAKALVEQVKEELKNCYDATTKTQVDGELNKPESQSTIHSAKKESTMSEIAIGIMIETPAAALMSDNLAKEADFFSIGTNDLIQYTMAADRLNDKVSYLYSFYQPSVLRLIQLTIENSHKYGIPVGLCGEAAREENLIPLWIGMGLDELSVNAGSILQVKDTILTTSYEAAKRLVSQVLDCASDKEVMGLLQKY